MKLLLAGLFISSLAFAEQTINVSSGQYRDNNQNVRTRAGLVSSVSSETSDLLTLGISLSGNRDWINGSIEDSGTIGLTQTWNKLTETRESFSALQNKDNETKIIHGTVGASQWVLDEQYKLSLDVTKTKVNRPAKSYVDLDSEIVDLPSTVDSDIYFGAVRQIVNTTTFIDYGFMIIDATDRPLGYVGMVAGKHYFKLINGAIYADLGRGINKGSIANITSYGEVDAWMASAQYAQRLPWDLVAGISYRYYRETESTRAFHDTVIFGTDTVAFGLAKTWPEDYSMGISYARFLANSGISAGMTEVSVSKKW